MSYVCPQCEHEVSAMRSHADGCSEVDDVIARVRAAIDSHPLSWHVEVGDYDIEVLLLEIGQLRDAVAERRIGSA